MGLIELKVIFSVVVFVTGGFGVLIPWVLRGGAPGERSMAWGDTFAGGVLGGAGLVHLLSGGADAFRTIAPGMNYPLAFALAGVGFLLVLFIESVIVADPDSRVSPLHCGSKGASHEIGPQGGESHPLTFILLLVLSVHSIIVGMALGVQSSLSRTLIVFAANHGPQGGGRLRAWCQLSPGRVFAAEERSGGFLLRHDPARHFDGHDHRRAGFFRRTSNLRGDL